MNFRTSVILLAGGTGSRMNASVPKQFLDLNQKAIARYSFELFYSMPEVSEIIVVCEPQYQEFFKIDSLPTRALRTAFALPGQRRQDSVYHGLQEVSPNAELVCVHDSARPFVDAAMFKRTLEAAANTGAATTGMPMKYTVKESCSQQFVQRTIPRSQVWEIQTPQIIRKDLLQKGFKKALEENLTVTDDVSLVELLGHPVKLVEGSYSNLKITTPEDFVLAENIAKKQF